MMNTDIISKTCLALIIVAILHAPTANAEEFYSGPIIDAHVHYSKPAWVILPPNAVIEKFDSAGVSKAMVSSTPDDGTLILHNYSPKRIIKSLRPYRTRADMTGWFADPEVVAYVKDRLARNDYRGFGEFHMFDPAGASTPEMKTLLKLAADNDLVLHSHSGPEVIEALAKEAPNLTILWAHAGMYSSPAAIADIFSRYDQVYADLSFRGDEMLRGGVIDAQWMALFELYPERFMIGTDTYINDQWAYYKELIDRHRRWLGQLPPTIAAAIASGNARKVLDR
jgi:predicted TIM-barrel fold metal-dependent hydrolase